MLSRIIYVNREFSTPKGSLASPIKPSPQKRKEMTSTGASWFVVLTAVVKSTRVVAKVVILVLRRCRESFADFLADGVNLGGAPYRRFRAILFHVFVTILQRERRILPFSFPARDRLLKNNIFWRTGRAGECEWERGCLYHCAAVLCIRVYV